MVGKRREKDAVSASCSKRGGGSKRGTGCQWGGSSKRGGGSIEGSRARMRVGEGAGEGAREDRAVERGETGSGSSPPLRSGRGEC